MGLGRLFRKLIFQDPKTSDVLRKKIERSRRVKTSSMYEIQQYKMIDLGTGKLKNVDLEFDFLPSWDRLDDRVLDKMCLELSGEISGPRAVLTVFRSILVHLYRPQRLVIKLIVEGTVIEDVYDRRDKEYLEDNLEYHKEKEFYPIMLKLVDSLYLLMKEIKNKKLEHDK